MICQYIHLTKTLLVCNASLLFTAAGFAQIKIEDPSAESLVDPVAKVEKLAGDMKFIEGPVWIGEKSTLVFSDIPNSVLMQWSKVVG